MKITIYSWSINRPFHVQGRRSYWNQMRHARRHCQL
ncbi:hypothetical protein QFZ49_007577 [Streptomyces turgidiscabies]|uniref:Uncharacterized protein n=1 Tax=Streptomyces turgidiscabies TaxID=85558 RepID=A0ABU0S038_9ACTN|nr:hypothetical protein [Streptomyces turgidiscabies]